MLLSVITPVDPSGINLENLESIARHLRDVPDVEWILATPEVVLEDLAARFGIELGSTCSEPLTPHTAPATSDLAYSSGNIRLLPAGSSGHEPNQVGLALGAARGRWTWVLGDADEPMPSALPHIKELLVRHSPAFLLGNALVSSDTGAEHAHTHGLPTGPLQPGALRSLWAHPDAVIPFSIRAVVFDTEALRRTGGLQPVDLAETLTPIMLADAAGQGFATTALLLHYRHHVGRTHRASQLHLEKIVRDEAWRADEQRSGLARRTTQIPSWHVRVLDPAPASWWPMTDPTGWLVPSVQMTPEMHSSGTQPTPTTSAPLSGRSPSLPMISILTATYPSPGREHFITELAESIFGQHGIDPSLIEWVVQEDSPVATLHERLPQEILFDPRVRASHNGIRLGAAATRNIALTRARGRVVMVADDDDVLTESACVTLVEHFKHPGVGWVAAGVESFDKVPFLAKNLAGVLEPHELALSWAHPTNIFPIVHSACAFRIDLLRAVGGWAALPQAEDMSMLVAASANARGYVLPVPVYRYRTHAEQMTAATGFSSVEAAARLAVWRRACAFAGEDTESRTAAALIALDALPAHRTSQFFRA
jgi:hypothetical protein